MLSCARLCFESMSDNVPPAAESAVRRLPRRSASVCLENPWGGSTSCLLSEVHKVIFHGIRLLRDKCMDPDIIKLLTLIGGLAAIGGMGALAITVAKRIMGDAGSSGITSRLEETEQRLADAEARIDELSRAEERLEELDERMEFAERLLQQQRDRERLSPGD